MVYHYQSFEVQHNPTSLIVSDQSWTPGPGPLTGHASLDTLLNPSLPLREPVVTVTLNQLDAHLSAKIWTVCQATLGLNYLHIGTLSKGKPLD